MRYLYNCLYAIALVCAAPWLAYTWLRTGKYRRGWSHKLLGRMPRRRGSGACIWLHAVSLGEMNLLPGLVAELTASRESEVEFVVSTTTDTGKAAADRHFPSLTRFYFPFDFTWSVSAALRRLRPRLIVLTELELWPNLIGLAARRRVPIVVVNGRLSDHSFRGYLRCRWLLRGIFAQLAHVAAQDAVSAERFIRLGVPPSRVSVTGSIKFDGALLERDAADVVRFSQLCGKQPEHQVWMAGSTCDPEEAMVLEIYQALRETNENLRLAIVPRHPERFDVVANLIEAHGLIACRRSDLHQNVADWSAGEVLLIDVCGELKSWWGVADVAYVGGSMSTGRGGQNMLEPCGYGVPVCFGPDTGNFRAIVRQLLSVDGVTEVADRVELQRFVANVVLEPHAASARARAARQLIRENQGATARTAALLWTFVAECVPEESDRPSASRAA